MELGFNVKNAGPLSQLSLHVLSLDAAVYLATGAYGWWKARERSQSLELVLAAANSKLVPTSSFNWQTYQQSRENGRLQAFVVQSGELQATSLPKASTATPSDPGIACLRALTTGLLCFYTVEATTTVLCEVIPSSLLQFDLEGQGLEIEGPLLSSLKHFVSAVAAEEDNNTFRQYLLEAATGRQFAINGVSVHETVSSERADTDEKPLAIGMLLWMLTPVHRRQFVHYPTRSLRVWLIGAVMEKLGFQLSSCLRAVGTRQEYERFVNKTDVMSNYADVILVTAPVGDTDPLILNKVLPAVNESAKPQIIPIRAIPWLAFRRARDNGRKANLAYLADVWKYSYETAYAMTLGLESKPDKHCRIVMEPRMLSMAYEREPPSDFHKTLITDWTIHLLKVCSAALTNFVPRFENSQAGWDAAAIRYTYFTLSDDDQHMSMPSENKSQVSNNVIAAKDSCLVLCAIVLGTIYGIASRCILDNTNAPLTLDSEIAFRPDIVYKWFDMHRLANVIGHGIDGTMDMYQWIDFVLDLSLGLSLNSGNRPLGSLIESANRLILGGVANGMSAVSKVLVQPSARQVDVITLFVQRGQLLNIPTTDEGFVMALSRSTESVLHSLTLDPEPNLEKLVYRHHCDSRGSNRHSSSSPSLRIDVEPSWEADPRQIVFRVRDQGRVIGTLDMNAIFLRAADAWVECSCGRSRIEAVPRQPQEHAAAERTQEVIVPLSERWQRINDVRQILTPYGSGPTTNGQVTINDEDKLFLDVEDDEMALLAAIGALRVRKLAVGVNCLRCAYDSIKHKEDAESAAIIMVKRN